MFPEAAVFSGLMPMEVRKITGSSRTGSKRESSTPSPGGQEYLTDTWCMIEGEKLLYLETHKYELRTEVLLGLTTRVMSIKW